MNLSARRRLATTVLLALSLIIAGCGSSGRAASVPSSSLTTTATVSKLARRYLAIAASPAAAIAAMRADILALGDRPTPAELGDAAAPVVTSLETAERRLLKVSWPAQTEIAVQALVRADNVVDGDLSALGSTTADTAAGVYARVVADVAAADAAANVVRADLQLPLLPAGSYAP